MQCAMIVHSFRTHSDYFAMTSFDVPAGASSAILKPSDPVSKDAVSVQGPNFDDSLDLQQFISSYERIGFQANSLGRAIHIINKMVRAVQRMVVALTTHSTQ
jgi:deoxyhypusine synthase